MAARGTARGQTGARGRAPGAEAGEVRVEARCLDRCRPCARFANICGNNNRQGYWTS